MVRSVLIVEDEPSIADTLIFALEKESFSPTRVATLSEARSAIAASEFSAIILDVGLPDGNGFDFCKELRKDSDIPVIFLTARGDEIDKIVGLEIGADDYVTKPFSPREITARLRAIFRRLDKSGRHSSEASFSSFEIDKCKRQIKFKNQTLELSRYEFGILELLLARPGQVFSRQQIMESVWEDPDMSLERTVDTHVKTLRGKLSAIESGEEYLLTHRGVGYSIKDEND